MKNKNKIFCRICNEKNYIEVKSNNFFLRTDSSNKELIDYKNYICANCGTIYHNPEINEQRLLKHYQTAYRNTDFFINLNAKKNIDLPLKFEWTGVSFQRFNAFYQILKKSKKIKFKKNDKIFDYGCYQGAFLYACKKALNVKVIGADYNVDGLKLANTYFEVDTFEINKNFFKKKINAKILTLIHVFEHLREPVSFLKKIKKNILKNEGLIYLEIPNPFNNPLNDPTHLFLYSEDTIKYILKSCNYEVIFFEKRGLYKDGTVLRNNNNLNLHILAKSLNKNNFYFPKINIGSKVHSSLIIERHFSGLQTVIKRIKYLFKNFLVTIYSLIMFIMNLINSNLTVYIHEKVKKLFKGK